MTVYGKIENGKFITAPNVKVEKLITEGYLAFDEADVANYFAGLTELSDGVNTADRLVSICITNLQVQMDELDKKRVRAGFEPSIKDESTGQTWLEYYNLQIQDLRSQIAELS